MACSLHKCVLVDGAEELGGRSMMIFQFIYSILVASNEFLVSSVEVDVFET